MELALRRAEVAAVQRPIPARALHLASLTNAGVIIMSVVLAAVVITLVLLLVSHH